MKSLARMFLYSAGLMLLITALAKLISGFGNARVLDSSDPILGLPFRYVFFGIGTIELTVAAFCFLSSRIVLNASLVACLAANFVLYRLGLLWIGYHKPCNCMGNLTDALHLSPQVADNLIKFILAYLLAGSCATLLWLWRQRHAAFPPTSSSIPSTALKVDPDVAGG